MEKVTCMYRNEKNCCGYPQGPSTLRLSKSEQDNRDQRTGDRQASPGSKSDSEKKLGGSCSPLPLFQGIRG